MMLRKVVSDQAGDWPDGAGGARARGGAFFAVPRLFVGFAAKRAPECDSSRSPTSPLEPKAFSALGGSLLRSPRSPRSWDSQRVGLGLVDSLAGDAKNCLFGPRLRLTSYSSLPKDRGHPHLELGKARSCQAAEMEAGGMPVPCARSYGDLKSGPEAIQPGGATGAAPSGGKHHSSGPGKFPASGSLPVSIGGPRRYIGSVPASEVEQSEDYTCIIARGPNPKTTHILGDCILEPNTTSSVVPDGDKNAKLGGTESYWLVKCAMDAGEDFLSFCFSCNKKLEGNDIYVYRGEKAFCSINCRDQEILIEEEAETNTAGSPGSSCSSFHDDDIFMAGMVVAT